MVELLAIRRGPIRSIAEPMDRISPLVRIRAAPTAILEEVVRLLAVRYPDALTELVASAEGAVDAVAEEKFTAAGAGEAMAAGEPGEAEVAVATRAGAAVVVVAGGTAAAAAAGANAEAAQAQSGYW